MSSIILFLEFLARTCTKMLKPAKMVVTVVDAERMIATGHKFRDRPRLIEKSL